MGSEKHSRREQKGSVPVTEKESRSFPQEETGKETVLEGGWVGEKLKKAEDDETTCFGKKG